MYIEHLDLESLIFTEIKTLQAWCMQKNIGFDVDLQAERVLCDAKWLSFIMRQLLTNAVKYSEEADVMIRRYEHHGQVYIEVKDNGRGISPQDMPRILRKVSPQLRSMKTAVLQAWAYISPKKLRMLFLFTLARSLLLMKAQRLHLPFLNQMILWK